MAQKKKMFETGMDFDWGTAEALAFGTLLLEGNHVRLRLEPTETEIDITAAKTLSEGRSATGTASFMINSMKLLSFR